DSRVDRGRAAWVVGIFSGLAVLSEFPAAIPVLFIVTLAWAEVRQDGSTETARVMSRIVAGGAVFGGILGAAHPRAVGSPLRLGYGNEDNAEGIAMQQEGLFGITHPTLHVAFEVLLGQYRGLLPLSPLVALTPVGLVLLSRAPERVRTVAVAALVPAF